MTNWNTAKSLKTARTNALGDVQPPTPPDFSDIGAPPTIEVGGVTTDFEFGISGVVPQRVDIAYAVLEEPIERWLARPRGATFEYSFDGLDPVLDSEFIASFGLTGNSGNTANWVGYYPGLSSSTQVGISVLFAEGELVSFTIAGGVCLAGTAYAANQTIYGADQAGSTTVFRGTVNTVNYSLNRITLTPSFISRTVEIGDPTQAWNIGHSPQSAGGGGGGEA